MPYYMQENLVHQVVNMKYKLVIIFSVINVITSIVYGQASSSTAELRGRVTDQSGAIIRGSKITLTDSKKGTVRTTVSDANGSYIFLSLLPGRYDLKGEASGFGAHTFHLELTVGQQAVFPFNLYLPIAHIDYIIDVEGPFDTVRSSQSSVVDSRQINNLPIGRRSYLDYALLTPGVADSDTIADASDFRVAQNLQSGLSFGGGNGRGNVVSIDGLETLTATGGVPATLSQEAIQEFQVLRNSYNAEFGQTSGGSVNIVSKSGANLFHGSAFGFFRDQAFDAKNVFDGKPDGKSTFNRQQYGGSFGGTVKKDKTFFFTSFERYTKDETSFVNLLRDPYIFEVSQSSSNTLLKQQAALFDYIASNSASTDVKIKAVEMRNKLTTSNNADTVNLFKKSSGQFPFAGDQSMVMIRADHNFSDKTSAYVRLYLNKNYEENRAAGALTTVSRSRTLDISNHGLIASHTTQFGNSFFNDVKFQYAQTNMKTTPNESFGPELNIEGYGQFMRDIFLPGRTVENHYDISDNMSKVEGSHTLKFGGSLWVWDIYEDSRSFFGGRFNFGNSTPLINILEGGASNSINQYLLTSGSPYKDGNSNKVADILETPMTSLQSFNLGLPIVYQQGFGNNIMQAYTTRWGFYAQDTWRAKSNLTLNYGLRYQINNEPYNLPTSYKDFQPRAGFAWEPFRDGKTVIRGGGGIFTGFTTNSIGNVTKQLASYGLPEEINLVLATATSKALGLPSSMEVYQALKNKGVIGNREITLDDVRALGINPKPNSPLEVRFRLGENFQNPASYQASFGIQQNLGKGYSFDAGYLYLRGIHIVRNRDINQLKRSGAANPLNKEGGATFVRYPNAAQHAAGITTDFANQARLQDNIYESTADSFYHALTASITKRFSRRFGLNAHYTFSKAIDEVTDYNSDFSAQNPLDVDADRAVSAFDQRHRAVVTAEIESPFQNIFTRNWRLAPIFIVGSGRPFNLLLGFDANGDGRSQSDRPGQAGRNTGIGEKYVTMDVRLARSLMFNESRKLEFTVEAFNLFNRINMQGINNIVGTSLIGASDFNLHGRSDRLPTQPLGFTSAGDARKFQLGFRFTF